MNSNMHKVVLALSAVLLVAVAPAASPARADMVQAVSFRDALGPSWWTTMTMAYDGKSYWSSSGGGNYDVQEARYDASGKLIETYAPGLDFRSIFTNAEGQLFARQYADPTIYLQVEPGAFKPFVTLDGGKLDEQSSVVLNGAGTEYIAMNYGTVDRWDLSGKFLGETQLDGYGKLDGEYDYPNGRGIAGFGKGWYTYSNGIMSTWDESGNRIATDKLIGGGTGFDSEFSFSIANGMPFVVDVGGGKWRGFGGDKVGPQGGPGAVPEPASAAMFGLGGIGLAGILWRRRGAIRLASA